MIKNERRFSLYVHIFAIVLTLINGVMFYSFFTHSSKRESISISLVIVSLIMSGILHFGLFISPSVSKSDGLMARLATIVFMLPALLLLSSWLSVMFEEFYYFGREYLLVSQYQLLRFLIELTIILLSLLLYLLQIVNVLKFKKAEYISLKIN